METTPQTNTPDKEPTLIEVPEHIQEALSARAISVAQEREVEASLMADAAAEVARSINDSRPEGIQSSLPDPNYTPQSGELTASTVRSRIPVRYTGHV